MPSTKRVRYTPASAATSLAGSYRPQWTKLKRSGGSGGDDDERELRDGDVRCSLPRTGMNFKFRKDSDGKIQLTRGRWL
jgi:uncharacterized protein with LGFP repeats